LHLDIQIHISPAASAAQVNQIFASMAKHLYGPARELIMIDARNILSAAKAIQRTYQESWDLPRKGYVLLHRSCFLSHSPQDQRPYKHITNQVNGAYEKGSYDACTVMIRRLLETLIIEAFEHHGIAANIKAIPRISPF
jgi:hypothetical protein